jgi:hypothetical protein
MPELWDQLTQQPVAEPPSLWPGGDRAPLRITVGGPTMKDGAQVSSGSSLDPFNPPQVQYVGKPLARTLESMISEIGRKGQGLFGHLMNAEAERTGQVPSVSTDYDPKQEAISNLTPLLANLWGVGAASIPRGAVGAVGSKMVQPSPETAAAVEELLGRFPTTTPGRIINRTKAGGYSVNLPTGDVPTSGLMMGKYANEDPRNIVTNFPPTRAEVQSHADTNAAQFRNPDTYYGTWHNAGEGGDNKVYFDVSKRYEPDEIRAATKYGERTGQKAGYDVGKGQSFPVGNWEEFINSPEFADRMRQMNLEGRRYLDQFPAKEWWDAHGSAFERVYGDKNLPQMSGFTATAAPNTAPYKNLQDMSEYMRRHLSGEPIIQPDWRVPAGTMSRNEGSKIGMEVGRTNNLLKSAAGDYEALRLNKVQNEARALMGDPDAVVLDRHWARLAEDPARGIFTNSQEGVISSTKGDYDKLHNVVRPVAREAGLTPRDFSANVWTGVREHLKNNSELFGTPFPRSTSIIGESKSYADIFEDVIRDKAAHMGISTGELEKRLRAGDAQLLSGIIATPVGAAIYAHMQKAQQPDGGL